ncbi:hypothetical protein Q31b_25450 [Novipirellula aureliae]|uniref:Uncharacterized protein n=1 Tax=Novipirellula aureliae TaxID=2527966 RepID=A0A5C6E4S8_9BACT|nr:hypothetical protein Q31b_25450 [Novipirellula aureliae]
MLNHQFPLIVKGAVVVIAQNPENLFATVLLIAGLIFAIGLVGFAGYAAFFSRH